jgi:flagellar L-ring protein precursor FlgH
VSPTWQSPLPRMWLAAAASLLALALATLASGCASHIAPYKPKKRHFDPGSYGPQPASAPGSLYASGNAGMFEDRVATRIGDMLVIRIDERESALRDATSKLEKKNQTEYGVPASLGLLTALQAKHPDLDPAKLFGSNSDSKFNGSGKLEREGRLNATLPVRVRQILPNGDFFVEGTKVVMVDAEEHHIYVSGVVRAADIAEDNSVPSSRVGDAEIEYAGRGDVSDQQRQGWFSRVLGKIWPF